MCLCFKRNFVYYNICNRRPDNWELVLLIPCSFLHSFIRFFCFINFDCFMTKFSHPNSCVDVVRSKFEYMYSL